ncbi:MAG: DNRLRE domain-containing protein [Phycisphaerales bacterium]
MSIFRRAFPWIVCSFAATASAAGPPEEVVLGPSRDATLVESPEGLLANGAGSHCFAGATGQPAAIRDRRGMLHFDLSTIPAGATIQSATLSLNCSRVASPASRTVAIHRLSRSWTEGPSMPIGGEGVGAPAQDGDCTWTMASLNGEAWTTPGGDFAAATSAATAVGNVGSYTWSGPGLVKDVAAWVADDTTNHGWIMVGDESDDATAKRFDTREIGVASLRPRLRVSYVLPPPSCPGDADGDGAVDFDDILAVLAGFGPCPPGSCPGDVDGDTEVSFADLLVVLAAFGPC